MFVSVLEPPDIRHFLFKYRTEAPFEREILLTIGGVFSHEKIVEIACRSEAYSDSVHYVIKLDPVRPGTKTKVI